MMDDRTERQMKAAQWVEDTFDREHLMSVRIRCLRFIEEAVELVQALGLPELDVYKVAHDVYEREPGEVRQEMGGVGLTLLTLATAVGHNADSCEALELKRVLSKPREIFRERNSVKMT